jgi:hypothetical protein
VNVMGQSCGNLAITTLEDIKHPASPVRCNDGY